MLLTDEPDLHRAEPKTLRGEGRLHLAEALPQAGLVCAAMACNLTRADGAPASVAYPTLSEIHDHSDKADSDSAWPIPT